MKNTKLNFLFTAAIAALVFLSGCKNACKDVDCNNGTCVDGTCTCDAGYQGTACDVMHNAKFVGVYALVQSCDTNGSTSSYDVTITASATNPSSITLFNIEEEPTPGINGVINDDGVSFTIAPQSIGTTAYGTVETTQDATTDVDGNSINLTYKVIITSTGAFRTCTGTMVRH